MATTLNIATELLVYEKFPKLCDYITQHLVTRWDDDAIINYLVKEGYDVQYYIKHSEKLFYNNRYVTFNDDRQYLNFVIKYS